MSTSGSKRRFEGEAKKSIEDAANDAGDKAKAQLTTPVWLKVVEVQVKVENPITEYKVILEEI